MNHQSSVSPVSPSTPREFITYAANRFKNADLFYGHGTDNAVDEAAYLVLRALGYPFDVNDQKLDTPLDRKERDYLDRLINRRIDERIPVAYLLNEGWFAGLPFYVDQHVLIPRTPLAELIEEKFSPWVDEPLVRNILDIGTGSACIAIACAIAFPRAMVDAVDIDKDALIVAGHNIMDYKLSDRINLICSDLFRNLPDRRYDVIVSNPPYVGVKELSTLPEEYGFEPVTALLAEDDGLAVIKEIIYTSGTYLTDHGILVIEAGNTREAVNRAFPGIPFTWLEFERGGEGVFLLTAEVLRGVKSQE